MLYVKRGIYKRALDWFSSKTSLPDCCDDFAVSNNSLLLQGVEKEKQAFIENLLHYEQVELPAAIDINYIY